jgi:NAD(P)-dependent dehydrogenase (short-subunit alcohol dehydrogenase family)
VAKRLAIVYSGLKIAAQPQEAAMAGLLKGKVAIVTGSGRGIGRAEALALAAEGARVVVNDVGVERDGRGSSNAPADEVVAQIKERGGEAVASYDSVADFRAAGRIIQAALDHFGRLDILVNNAGIFRDVLFHQMSEADWDDIVAVHLKGTFNTCRHAVPVMMRQNYGRIVNTASSQWRNPEGRAAYGAAKGGIVSLTWDLAWEMQNQNISVNAIAPMAATRNVRDSGTYHQLVEGAGLVRKKDPYEQARPGPEFVPPMVVYLASDLAAGVTGLVFRVGAGKIGVYSHPTEIRSVYREFKKDGPWTLEELQALLPATVLSGQTKAPHIP